MLIANKEKVICGRPRMAEAGDVQKEINQGMDWTHRVYMGLKSEEDKVCHLRDNEKKLC